MKNRAHDVLQWFLKQVYPARCPVCNRVLYQTYICPDCHKKIKYVTEPVCYKCGKPVGYLDEYCSDCIKSQHVFTQGKAVWLYQGQMRNILYRYKYSNRRDYTEFLASEAVRLYGDWMRQCGIEVAMPIPLSRKKLRKRGYNQAELLARQIARLGGLAYDAQTLARIRDTAPQKQLSAQERKNNMKNAFKIVKNVVNLKRVMLVDDIYTTGSTIDAAARVLREAGVEDVYFLCISIGEM